MQQLILLDKNDLEELKTAILKGVKELLSVEKPKKPTKLDSTIEGIESYIILKDAIKKLGTSNTQWHRKYKHIIQWKKDGQKIWVYLPSIEKYLRQDNIND